MQRVQLKQEAPAQVDERCWGCDICFSVCCCAGVQHVCMITLRFTEGWTEELCATITIIYHHLSISVKITGYQVRDFLIIQKEATFVLMVVGTLGIFRYYNCIYLLTFTTLFLVLHPQTSRHLAMAFRCRLWEVPLWRSGRFASSYPRCFGSILGWLCLRVGRSEMERNPTNRGLVDDVFSNSWCLKFHFEA